MTETSNGSSGKLTREAIHGAKALNRIPNTATGSNSHDLYLLVTVSN